MANFLKCRKKLITAAAIAVYFFGTNSANAATAEGKIIIFPWVMEGTTAEFNTSVKTQLSKALENAAGSLGQISQLSKEYDRSSNKVRNIAKAMKNFLMITPPKQVPLEDTIIVQPYMCKAGNQMIATIVSHTWKNREILSINHQSFEQSSLFKKRIKKTNFYKELQNNLNSLTANNIIETENRDNLKIKITSKRSGLRRYNSKYHCMNHLLASSLSENYKIVTTVGYENYAVLKRSKLLPKSKPMRATRELIVDWVTTKTGSMNYTISNAEAVFGQSINKTIQGSVTSNPESKELTVSVSSQLEQYLAQEKRALRLNEPPMISKKYKAWSYIDKGRAWGLKIGDRLITSDENGNPIKGHVVGFFGPEHKITSPRGYPVNEGAIVYIRKGQKEATKGQVLTWDTKKFPTPWPPKFVKQ